MARAISGTTWMGVNEGWYPHLCHTMHASCFGAAYPVPPSPLPPHQPHVGATLQVLYLLVRIKQYFSYRARIDKVGGPPATLLAGTSKAVGGVAGSDRLAFIRQQVQESPKVRYDVCISKIVCVRACVCVCVCAGYWLGLGYVRVICNPSSVPPNRHTACGTARFCPWFSCATPTR